MKGTLAGIHWWRLVCPSPRHPANAPSLQETRNLIHATRLDLASAHNETTLAPEHVTPAHSEPPHTCARLQAEHRQHSRATGEDMRGPGPGQGIDVLPRRARGGAGGNIDQCIPNRTVLSLAGHT